MKIGVVGVKGMLGSELALRAAAAGHHVKGYDLPELDISRDLPVGVIDPEVDALINCSAYTDVDGAETSSETAFAVNADGAGRLAAWCTDNGCRLLHLSTDYVFDGEKQEPYTEEDETRPLSVYGESKLAGESAVLAAQGDALIVRTQALFGPRGKSFPAAIIAKLDDGVDELKVVDDQTVCPTCTGHLADAILALLETDATQVVHVASDGECTWHEFAVEIAKRIRPGVAVLPVPTTAFPRPARRPAHSVLSKSRYAALTGRQMPTWQDALGWYLGQMGRQDG